ncbi:MAG: hypothetical protein NTY19_43005 [Planctomycetota bacterium]|nr:hypothetical protein [Planctomycetota bacterium]
MQQRHSFALWRAWIRRPVGVLAAGLLFGSLSAPACAQVAYENEPINYLTAPVTDPVARLQRAIDAGQAQLTYDDRHGYLESVLNSLNISPASQVLVFSKTSFQRQRISPKTPRSLYFNDDVYIGWVQGGEVLEGASVDRDLGTIFYTLEQEPKGKPKFVRDRGDCLSCHASANTRNVPGLLVRSVYSSPSGLPHFGAGTFRTNHSSPLKERWGGWYVTGTHGTQRHLGNVVSQDSEHPDQLDLEAGANLTDLTSRCDVSPYLRGHSDIVALMVLEHQVDLHDLITTANYEARLALRDAAVLNKMLNQPADTISPSIHRRLESAGDKVLKYLLFVDEAPLTDRIWGTSGFAEEFAARGPCDQQGRSLRQFDLQRRLFKYPCSYLIYSASFDALPPQVKQHIYRRLQEILTGQDADKDFAHLSAADRQAILEILRATKPDLAGYWKSHP